MTISRLCFANWDTQLTTPSQTREKIAEAIGNVRAAGYDIVLKLDATIGLAQRPSQDEKMTTHDRRFLEALHIRVDEEVLDEQAADAKVEITQQDIKFLKSLKISLDDEI